MDFMALASQQQRTYFLQMDLSYSPLSTLNDCICGVAHWCGPHRTPVHNHSGSSQSRHLLNLQIMNRSVVDRILTTNTLIWGQGQKYRVSRKYWRFKNWKFQHKYWKISKKIEIIDFFILVWGAHNYDI
jgi:hypothetical protein